MPFAFQSLNRWAVPYGFFNIETDLLLLDQYFFFVEEFCQNISEMSEKDGEELQKTTWKVYNIENSWENLWFTRA